MKERPLRKFVDPQKISRHLFCPICHEVFDDPNRLSCGHTFCYMCIQQWATLSRVCPLCKKSLKHRRPEKDLIAASLIDEMPAMCSHQKCEWTGVYSSLKKHQRMCNLRQRRAFESRNFDQIVEVNDDQQMKDINEVNKNGRKKLKTDLSDGEVLPVFQQSEEQQEKNQRNIHQNSHVISSQSSSNSYSNNQRNQSGSNSNDSSFDLKITQLKKNNNSIKPISSSFQQDQTEQKKQKKSQQIDNGQDIQLDQYLYKPIQKKNNFFNHKLITLTDQQLPNIDSNYFIIQKSKQQQEKRKKQSNTIKNKWGLTYQLQKQKQYKERNKQQELSEDSSSFSNPFDEPIKEIKKNSQKQYIIIDSSEQSRCQKSVQSGEMSFLSRKRFEQEKTSQKVQFNFGINYNTCNNRTEYRRNQIEGYLSENH